MYLEPFERRNQRAFGFDMYSEPVRRTAMARARDAATAVLSGRVTLVQEDGDHPQAGTLLYLPVFRRGMPTGTVDERRAALLGWVYMPLRMDNLMRGLLGAGRTGPRLELFDGRSADPAMLLHDSDAGASPLPLVQQTMTIVAGREWTLRVSVEPRFARIAGLRHSHLVLLGGLILAGAALTALRASGREQRGAAQLATELANRRATEGRLAMLLTATPAVLFSARLVEGLPRSFVSDNVARVLGYTPQQFAADPGFWADRIHPDDRARVLGTRERLLVQGHLEHEYRFLHADGAWRWMRGEVTLVAHDGGAPTEAVGFWIDITDRVAAETERHRIAARLEFLLDASPAVVYAAGAQGDFGATYVSRNVREQLGWAQEEYLGDPRFRVGNIHPDDRARVLDTMERILREDGGSVEYRFRHRDGSWRYLLDTARLQRDAAGAPLEIVGLCLDITSRHQMEQALARAQRMRFEFMTNVTHELRTPLNAVIGFAELLASGTAGPLAPAQAEHVADIVQAGQRLSALVDAILEMTQADAERHGRAQLPAAFGDVLASRIAVHRRAAQERGIAVDAVVTPQAEQAAVEGAAMRRMLDVLLDNAVKFNRDGGGVAVRARCEGGVLEVAVEDSGPGIAAHDLPRLFHPFVQLDASLARQHGGLGLGLALARRLAERHGGTIDVRSEPGHGSVFRLRLPAQTVA